MKSMPISPAKPANSPGKNGNGHRLSQIGALLPDAGGRAGFEGLLALVGERYAKDVEAYEETLAALRRENTKLARQLKESVQNGKVKVTNGHSQPLAQVNGHQLPGEVPTSPKFHLKDCSEDEAQAEDAAAGVPRAPPGSPVPDGSPRDEDDPAASHPLRKSANSYGYADSANSEDCGDYVGVMRARTDSDADGIFGAFPMKDVWKSQQDSLDLCTSESVKRMVTLQELEQIDEQAQHSGSMKNKKAPWFIAQPTNRWRLAWDFAGAVLIFYDLFQLPMEAFNPPGSAFKTFMDWVTLIFWTINMAASVTVGYSSQGILVLDPWLILVRYLKTWLVLDLIVVAPDWIFTIAALTTSRESGGGEDGVKLIRIIRLVRMVRLVRLLKLRVILERFHDLIASEYTSVILNILQMIMALLVINHLLCCVWYLVAMSMEGKEPNWVEFHEFKGERWEYLYVTSFHWSITQFTPASMHVQPQNMLERSFAVIVVIFALVGFSYIVGSITGSLAELRSMNAEESKLFWDLRRYLAKNKVQRNLSFRIQKYLEHMWQVTKENKPVKQVKLIGMLSEQLDSELKCELAVTELQIHPFLAELCRVSSVTVHRLANSAVSNKKLAEGDTLFHAGEAATHMSIVVTGRLVYKRFDASGQPHIEQVDNGEDWIAEPALWSESWAHIGQLTAVEHADNVTINAHKFGDNVKLNPQALLFASGYAKNYLRWLNALPAVELSDISQGELVSDLHCSFMPEIFRSKSMDPHDGHNNSGTGWMPRSMMKSFNPFG